MDISAIRKLVFSHILLLYAKRHGRLYRSLSFNIIREIGQYLYSHLGQLIDLHSCSMRTYRFLYQQWSTSTPLVTPISVDWSRWMYLDWDRSVFACGGEN